MKDISFGKAGDTKGLTYPSRKSGETWTALV